MTGALGRSDAPLAHSALLAMAQTFSFPILTDAELLPCLRDMELPLSAAGLAKPTPELVRPVYESLVTTLVGVTRRAPAGPGCTFNWL